jgi:TM2 domain-containing membrane protein YozV
MTILFIFTFVFGIIRLITFMKIFNFYLNNVFQAFFVNENRNKTVVGGLLVWIDQVFFYFSLLYQTYFWFSYFNVL